MKKRIIAVLICVVLALATFIYLFTLPIDLEGIFESQDPKIRIKMSDNPAEFCYDGEYILDNGKLIKIVFFAKGGNFKIYKFIGSGLYDSNVIFHGKYAVNNKSTLKLKCDDNSVITLEKVKKTDETFNAPESFSIDGYGVYIKSYSEKHPTAVNVGAIENTDDAIIKAKKTLNDIYDDVESHNPYRVFYDKENGYWFVEGSLSNAYSTKSMKGGVPSIIFNSNGDIAALWHGK